MAGIGDNGSGVSDGMSAAYDVSYAMVTSTKLRNTMKKSSASRCAFEGSYARFTKAAWRRNKGKPKE